VTRGFNNKFLVPWTECEKNRMGDGMEKSRPTQSNNTYLISSFGSPFSFCFVTQRSYIYVFLSVCASFFFSILLFFSFFFFKFYLKFFYLSLLSSPAIIKFHALIPMLILFVCMNHIFCFCIPLSCLFLYTDVMPPFVFLK
jgi:hypothetical protein